MGNQIRNVFGMNSVQDSVEVCSVWEAVLRVVVLHVLHDIRVRFELGKDVIHTKLVELRNVDKPALADFEKLFLAFEHFAKEVPVGRRRWRYIVLHYKGELYMLSISLTMVAEVRE